MSDEKFTTVGELKKILEQYDDGLPVFVEDPEHETCYFTEFAIATADVWVGKVVVIAPHPDDEEDDSES
jgi:hypothetical protein